MMDRLLRSELKEKDDVTKNKRNNRHGDIPWQVRHSVVILKKCFDKYLCVDGMDTKPFKSLVPLSIQPNEDGFSNSVLAITALLNYCGVQISYLSVKDICYDQNNSPKIKSKTKYPALFKKLNWDKWFSFILDKKD